MMPKTSISLVKLPLLALACCLLFVSAPTAAKPELPVYDGLTHMGVASCANSLCHGAVIPHINSNISNTEYTTWARKDPHAKTFKDMMRKEYSEITRKLGMKTPQQESRCLACHASNIPPQHRGARFSLDDGIGCESCHGGAEKYLATHTGKDATRQKNIANGLYPTDDMIERTRLCLSCHYGNRQQFVSHEIMAAGHPRMSFEMDTFSELLNPHVIYDEDYRLRKPVYSHVKMWALGQALAAEAALDLINSERLQSSGLFPELSLFDCHSCHHPMSKITWHKWQSRGLGPGAVRLNDSSLLMLRLVLQQVAPKLGADLSAQLKALHVASNSDLANTRKSAARLKALVKTSIERIDRHEFGASQIVAITSNLIAAGIEGEFQDYIAAEQSVMAIGALTAAWNDIKPFDATTTRLINEMMDRLYAAVASDENFVPYQFKVSMMELKKGLLRETP